MDSGVSNRVMTINYHLKDTGGETLDSSTDGPLTYLSGRGQIIPKLEEAISSMMIGQKKTVEIGAADAYGVFDPKMIMEVPTAELSHLKIEVGGFLQLDLGGQIKVVKISAATDTAVTLDGNHPLAGKDLIFDIELVDSRQATTEEIAHGHAHGPGGHHH